MLLVENTTTRVLGPTIPQDRWPKDFDGILILRPGVNVVAEDVWAIAKETKFVKRMLGKSLVVRGELVAEGLSGMSQLKALELVKGTLNIGQLEEWLETESRRKVVNAITKQLEVLNKGRIASQDS